jgi:hypothetical protein
MEGSGSVQIIMDPDLGGLRNIYSGTGTLPMCRSYDLSFKQSYQDLIHEVKENNYILSILKFLPKDIVAGRRSNSLKSLVFYSQALWRVIGK